jgi:FtsP/CotA-like multicopper oxidase with cupredoxin domain
MTILSCVLAAALAAALPVSSPPRTSAVPAVERVVVNDNRTPAGILRNGVLTLRLEAREGEWRPDRESDPSIVVRAFAEQGKPLRVPGPLIRVPEGTEIHAFVTNTLARGTLVVHNLSPRGIAVRAEADTIRILPGATREVRFAVGAPGTYYYWGTIEGGATRDSSSQDAQLNGAFVVDPRGAPVRGRDRVFVIGLWTKTPLPGGLVARNSVLRFTINGRTWPNTERLSYALGDTVRFRIVNTSAGVHPLHLHGFYFDVNSRGDGTVDSVYAPSVAPYRVVTERTAPGRTYTMTWVPERAGNWLFHCHDNYHVLRSPPLDGAPLVPEEKLHVANHAMDMMGGLVMGIEVRGQDRTVANTRESSRRRLHLVAQRDSGGTDGEPSYGYSLLEGKTPAANAPLLPGPTILLKRGEPVSITVVNRLPEATAVHWHGIELESYFDGVAGYAGHGRRIAPAIAPGDSFEARFTPPRSGTFMYHPHADEVRQQQAGLSGVLLVVDDPTAYDPSHDIVLLLTVPRRNEETARAVLVNGSLTPPPLELRVGERYTLRFVDVHTFRPSMIARLLRDSTLATWRAVAKDGMPVPPERAMMRPSMQQMGNGETYDFELTPATAGDMRITVSSAAGQLLATVPVRVR